MAGRLRFSGPFAGYFLFFIPRALSLSLAADFLGKDEGGISQDHVTGTVKEIINMIAGSTFSNYDDSEVFRLDLPELVGLDEALGDDPDSEEMLFIAIETPDDKLALKMVKKRDG